jgi:hypothetical protein
MSDIEIKLDTRGLDFLIGNVSTKAEQLLDAGAHKIEKRWKEYIVAKKVIDTSAYLNSIHVKGEHKALEREISDGVDYGIHQEYGTIHFGARPCATPAVEDERKPLTESWKKLFT